MTGNDSPEAKQVLVQLPHRVGALPASPMKGYNFLSNHPLFEPERIKRLLRTLPRQFIEIRAVQTVATNDGSYLRGEMLTEADPVDSFERLEEKPTWMLLHKTWLYDKDYAQLLNDYIHCLREQCGEVAEGTYKMGCWMFLSSRKGVVHFHSDSDQSFLNQIRGSKTVILYPSKILPEQDIEALVHTDQQIQSYRPEYEEHAFSPIHLSPGESAFLPLYAPHRVVNDDCLCISWNVGFHTRHSMKRSRIHLVNRELRSFGINPSPYVSHPLRDSVKARTLLAFRTKNKLLSYVSRREKRIRPLQIRCKILPWGHKPFRVLFG